MHFRQSPLCHTGDLQHVLLQLLWAYVLLSRVTPIDTPLRYCSIARPSAYKLSSDSVGKAGVTSGERLLIGSRFQFDGLTRGMQDDVAIDFALQGFDLGSSSATFHHTQTARRGVTLPHLRKRTLFSNDWCLRGSDMLIEVTRRTSEDFLSTDQ